MVLPNYFIADLPPDYQLQPGMIIEACQTLKRNRERYLLSRSTESIIQSLVELARFWAGPDSVWRSMALDAAGAIGFSREVLAEGLDAFFRQLTARQLNALIVQEFGHSHRVDKLAANDAENLAGLATQVRGPELLVHVTAGMLPTPVFLSIVHGLLVRSAQFVKCASGAALLPRLFAHSLRDVDPKLASCLELGSWKGGNEELEQALFAEAGAVVASGSDDTMDALHRRVPRHVRLLAHGHRVSAGYVARETLSRPLDVQTVAAAAADVAAWDQLGCLSPHVIYVETGGVMPPEAFAAALAEELERVEQRLPRGPATTEVAATIFQRREFYRIRAASDPDTKCHFSRESTAWSVVFEPDLQFQVSCLHRFIYVKPVDTQEELLRRLEPWRGKWSTVGLASVGVRAGELAEGFARWGVTRICPLGRMQRPGLTWRQDGRPVLGDLVQWTVHELPQDV